MLGNRSAVFDVYSYCSAFWVCLEFAELFLKRGNKNTVLQFQKSIFWTLESTVNWNNNVTCRVVRLTKMTGSSSDDWIFWHLGYKPSQSQLNTALSLIYTYWSSPGDAIKTQEHSHWITHSKYYTWIKSSNQRSISNSSSATSFPWLSPTENWNYWTRSAIRLYGSSFARIPRKTPSSSVVDACLQLRFLTLDLL
jgi:hypothetical protein